ncbi:ALBINO3-like protein 1, chloroplastic [Rhodamnia argentea]|uniref:ALBINO3-like protein 1, chloroplastic n=1 Tax=Rhodamnia argentea TaxID=178133 RepID=A0A8B8Q4B4_9MYRT|nr:ALBINO3-like protein 1, chloroplastic [Rhodamnia argentea]XP_030541929.1 ALBINO3-like protein 1, chloroplastic [Rhodamnia argentea]XP_048137296.1 ALBINO3-like protein 1, chloroplastic [Rhodamnia argentea]
MSHSLTVAASNPVLSPFPRSSAAASPLLRRSLFGAPSSPQPPPLLRGTRCVARLGFNPDPESAEVFVKELFGRAEGLLYTIADAAVSSSSDAVTSTTVPKQDGDWLSGISNYMESVLKVLKDGLSTLHVPYAYGFAIILLTVLVKAATFPLTKKQVESAMAMRSLQPQIKAIQERYAGDQERIQLETARLYKLAGINPLAGCLPTLATIPVWIGLYRALSNVADEGLLTEGFFWIPSLAGPTTIAARQNGSGISWLFPFVDGHPPLGWSDTLAYLVLPVLLVFTQYMSVQIMRSSQSNDPSLKSSQAITKFLPLMIGYFSLSVPSGLSLYWLTNNILSTAQQVWLQKFGGAENPLKQSGSNNTIKLDETRNQKSASEFISTKKVQEKENLTVEGPRPGERFKQIKEQEERRRREREQQKKDAKLAVKEIPVADERHEKETSVQEVNNETRPPLVDKSTEEPQYANRTYHSSNGGAVVNGNLSSPELQEDKNASPARSDKGAVVTNNDVERSDN